MGNDDDSVFGYRKALPVRGQIVTNLFLRGNHNAFIDDTIFQSGADTDANVTKQDGFFYYRLVIGLYCTDIPPVSIGRYPTLFTAESVGVDLLPLHKQRQYIFSEVVARILRYFVLPL